MPQPVAPPVQQGRKPTLLEAVSAASASFGGLTKDSKNDYLKSQYLALPGLLRAIKQPLLEHGVVIYTQIMRVEGGTFVVHTTLALADGSEEISSSFPVFDPTNMHKIGAAVTYGTRYNLLALLAVCPDNDDDGNMSAFSAAPQGLPGGLPGGITPAAQAPQQQAPWTPPAIAQPVQPSPVLYQ